MIIRINVDELRRIAILSGDAATKMNDSNTVISTVISKHDWKCPERVTIDETLETIKANSVVLNDAFEEFSNKVVELANNYTEYINDRIRDDAELEQDIAEIISGLSFGGVTSRVSGGVYTTGLTTAMTKSSMNEANIVSLQGASSKINIADFSMIRDGN
ncbi:MAG: hypothetical protein K6E26_05785 [Clostridiales bacterium]|nr:hypothetical protein [Clostridiales bacterium]MCR5274854.1 hypothetical protein [Clostridiales bacterium]